MLKPSLQLKLGQQLTMTPQLQQAIRLLQLPALELQAHIRELLETNVMLEPVDEAHEEGVDASTLEHTAAPETAETQEGPRESAVEVLDEDWGEHSVGPAETPWSGDDDDRQRKGQCIDEVEGAFRSSLWCHTIQQFSHDSGNTGFQQRHGSRCKCLIDQ